MTPVDRRRLLRLGAGSSLLGLTGCVNLFEDTDEEPDSRPDDWCVEEYDEEVPESQRTAESIDGIERDPDDLSAREDVGYQCSSRDRQLCANCRFWIRPEPDEEGEIVGACARVEGRVRSVDWCGLWQPTERLEDESNTNEN